MAFNPSPEVQVARDAAKAMTALGKKVNRCIVLFTCENDEVGYASYGVNSKECGEARRIADTAFAAVLEGYEQLMDQHCSYDRELDGTNVDWDGLAASVHEKIMLLKACAESSRQKANSESGKALYAMMVRDLFLPSAELLGRFDMSVNVTVES